MQSQTKRAVEPISLATQWLLNSKIHNKDPADDRTYGSFNNYLDINKLKCEFAYTEITGYAVQLLVDLYKRNSDPMYLEHAKTAANWILKMQFDAVSKDCHGGYLYCFRLAERQMSEYAYPFDAGICLGAISDLYRVTREKKYLDSAERAVNWLVKVMQNLDGSFKHCCTISGVPLNEEQAVSPNSIHKKWFNMPGCHHGKIIIGLLKYYQAQPKSNVLTKVTTLSKWLKAQQNKKGNFRIVPGSSVSFSHTHCYATEGLLYAYAFLKDPALLESATAAADWLIERQRGGRIPAWINTGRLISYTDISAVAQAIRIWCVLYSETDNSKYLKAINRSVNYLVKVQNRKPNPETAGGFYLAEIELGIYRYRLSRLYSWATIFALHALRLARDLQKRKIEGTELW